MAGSSHPKHPMLVHFPIACWSLATAGDVASLFIDRGYSDRIEEGTVVLLAIGLLSAVVAMLAGALELGNIDPQSPAIRLIGWHITLVGAAWMLYAVSLMLRVRDGQLIPPGWIALVLSATGFVCLCIGGWFGGRMVFEHGVGVRAAVQRKHG